MLFEITHILLVSYGGRSLTDYEHYHNHSSQVTKISIDLLRLGVRHEDLRPDNVLWSEELKRVLLIDLERSRICFSVERHLLGLRTKRERQASATETPLVSDEAVGQGDFLWDNNDAWCFDSITKEGAVAYKENTYFIQAEGPTMQPQGATGKENETLGAPIWTDDDDDCTAFP
ncbi:MAG: hypothetical protein Q9208_008135 [Pyrenodesmia sp. 3 TL-2023]